MGQTGAYGWLLQRLSGVVLLVLLVVHFFLMHYMGFEKRTYALVMQRFSNPMWKTFDLLFLTLGLYHGWYGVWGVVGDYIRRDSWRVCCLVAIVTVAAFLYVVGIVTVLSFRA